MIVESATDRAAFLADFGEDVTYTSAGVTVTLQGIPSAAYVEVAEFSGTGIAARGSALKVIDADLPADTDRGNVVTRADGVPYTVSEIRPDGTGFTLLVLERQ